MRLMLLSSSSSLSVTVVGVCARAVTQKHILKMNSNRLTGVTLLAYGKWHSFFFFSFCFVSFGQPNENRIRIESPTTQKVQIKERRIDPPTDRPLTSGISSGTFPIHDSDTIEQSHFVFEFFSKCKCIVMSTLYLRFSLFCFPAIPSKFDRKIV